MFLGPLLGAALLHVTGVGVVFLAAAGAYLVSTLLLLPVRFPRIVVESGARPATFLADVKSGARSVAVLRDTRVVLLMFCAQNVVAGVLNVLIVVTALRILDLGQTGVGTLTAALGVGGVLGGALVFGRLRRARYGVDLAVGLVLWGIPLVILAFVSSAGAALPLLGVVGVGVTIVDVAAVTLLQRTVSQELLPHALGLLQAVFVGSVAVGTLLAPVFVSTVGDRGALLLTGAVLPVLAITYWSRLRTLDERHTAPHFVSLLAAIPIFAPLSEAALDHLAASLRPLAVAAGDAVFEQGDPGDAFYVVERGEVDVVIDGELVRTQGPGESFGEIALLRDVPRTATVLARSDVRLLRLERAPFLAAVTGNAASADAADALVGARLGFQVAF